VAGELLFHPRFQRIPCLATILRCAMFPCYPGPPARTWRCRSIVADSLLLKHQLLLLNRSRQRSPNLCAWDRILAGGMALLIPPTRLLRSAIVLKPSMLLAFHKAMSKRKYRTLFSPNRGRKPGPKDPSAEFIQQPSHAFLTGRANAIPSTLGKPPTKPSGVCVLAPPQ